MNKYDAIVIGLGAMGGASVYQIAKAGGRVLGIDQFVPPHTYGSSHGETRITRQAIAEGTEYVPLVRRANEIWKDIEAVTGEKLFTQTGILIMASNAVDKPNKFVDNTIAAAQQYGIKHEVLSASDIQARYSQFAIQGDEKGYFEDGAGFLRAEVCVSAQLELAGHYGAELHTNERFLRYEQTSDGIVVTTDKAEYLADKLVLAVGPWVNAILPAGYKNTIQIYRQVLYWFEVKGDIAGFQSGKFPVFNWEFNAAHEDFIYGFPSLDGRSIKVATEQYSTTTDPGSLNRDVDAEEIKKMHEKYIAPHFANVSDVCLRAEACMYSVAPDWRFLIDFHPDNPNVVIASPCSGHGFKHSAAIGEVVADMVAGRRPRVDVSAFSFDRLAQSKS